MSEKFQIRLSLQQKIRWLEQARQEELSLSEWIRLVCDTASDPTITRPPTEYNPVTAQMVAADVIPEHPPMLDAADVELQRITVDESRGLASNCSRADLHWRLSSGTRCSHCKGIA